MEQLAKEGRLDLSVVFNRLPTPFMVLDRDLNYVGMNQAYLDVVGRSREDLVGKHIFDAFPEEGEARRQLEESFERAFESGRTDHIPYIHYRIARPEADGGGLVDRYWSATHTAIPGSDGRPEFLVQHTQDITEFMELKRTGASDDEGQLGQDILQRARTVQAQTEELRQLFDSAPGFMAILRTSDFIIEWANDATYALVGDRDLVGLPMEDAMPELKGQGFRELLKNVVATRTAYVGHQEKILLKSDPDRPLKEHLLDFIFQPIPGEDGKINGVFVQGQDVTHAAQAQAKQRLLLDELNHRVKNTLATVQAIASQTLKPGVPVELVLADFQSRLMALSNTHDALTGGGWQGVELRGMLEAELKPYADGQTNLTGERINLPARLALPMGMVLHELSTNAAKYGSLSVPEGWLDVSWRVDGDTLRLLWNESGGPPVETPDKKSFGTRLIERSLRGELGGEVDLDFKPEGLKCKMTFPLSDPAP